MKKNVIGSIENTDMCKTSISVGQNTEIYDRYTNL